MTGFIAVLGFWVFMIAGVLRFGQKRKVDTRELEQLRGRIQQLEHQLGSLETQLVRLADGHDFTLKLLKEPPKSGD